jgi:hypothetical protein
MNNRQNITTFDTRYLGNALEKPTRGKQVQERFFIKLIEKYSKFTTIFYSKNKNIT